MRSTYADKKSRPKDNVIYDEYPSDRLSYWDQFQHGHMTPRLPPVTRMLYPPTRWAHHSDDSIPHQGNTYNNATVCATPTPPQQNLSRTSYPHVHYNFKHPPATGGMPTPNCYRKSDNLTRHPIAVDPDHLKNQENKRPTYTWIDEAPLAVKPAAASGEHPVTNDPPTYEASHHSWYQQMPPVAYGTTGPSMSPTAYGDVMDGSIHFIPGYVQSRPPQVRLQSYNNTTVGGLPDYFIPPGPTNSYFPTVRRPGTMDNVKGK